jgi:MSHA biogenesis protein MshL
MLGTLSGMPVKITSGNEIPYVKTVGSSVAAGGAVAGSIQTEIIISGLDLEVTPYFDAADASLVTKVKVSMSALVGFRELSAGPSAGKISQPEIQKLTFENVGRLNAGETVIMGGITYDQQTDNYQTLPGLENMEAGSKSQKNNRQAIYIVVRPTVVIFTADADKLNADIKNGVQSKPKLELENSLTTPVLELDSAADAKAEVAVLHAQKKATQ